MHEHNAAAQSSIRRSQHYPTTSTVGTAEQHWSAILQYDASRRQASLTAIATTEGKASRPMVSAKRMSIGDDLPPMPQEPIGLVSTYGRSPAIVTEENPDTTTPLSRPHLPESAMQDDDLTLGRRVTPTALKGDNAVLVDRELQRLRERKPNAVRMHWRVLTGTMMLFVLGMSTYVLAESIRAYLALSPTPAWLQNVVDATQPTDPLMRTVALIEVVAAGLALLGTLASGFYLRMTRRRTCGRTLIWCTAIIATTIHVALSLANIALIVAWHKRYAGNASNPLARTRDVGQRCKGTWDMDILWSAAAATASTSCSRDSANTVQHFLIAGGVRLGLFVMLCTLWLACLAKYNSTLRLQWTHNESIDESPEMHKLLADEKGLPAMPTWAEVAVPGAYKDGNVDHSSYEDDDDRRDSKRFSKGDDETLVHMPERRLVVTAAPPKLDRFNWQRGEPSHTYEEAIVLANISRHDRQQSSTAGQVMDRLWNALWGSSGGHEHGAFESVAHSDEEKQQQQQLDALPSSLHPWHGKHDREGTRLGVRGWFRRSFSGLATASELEMDEDVLFERRRIGGSDNGHVEHSPTARTATQETRTQQGRHTAARRVQEERADPYTGSNGSVRDVRKSVQDRIERRKIEQRQRIEFLASLGRSADDADDDGHDAALPLASKNSSSIGQDTLLRMPEPQRTLGNQEDDELGDTFDEEAFWHAPASSSTSSSAAGAANGAPVFVRQLGKLVRKMSAIESVGSGGERSQRMTSREASTASGGRLY